MTGNNYSESMSIQTQSTDAQPIHYINCVMFSIDQVGKDKDCPPRCNLDSHADTCVAGGNALEISHEDGRTVTSSGFSSKFKPRLDIRVSTVAFLWEDPESGKQNILIMHEALHFGNELDHSLFNPNQLRDNGIIVEDVP
jgi:hypothetical protein